jgi:GntP family gluconate:H+ symporter
VSSWYPLTVLAIGLVVVVGSIIFLRVHAFLALIAAAIVVSLLAPGEWAEKIPRVAGAFGATATSVGVVIALAAIIGMAMTASGAADRVVRMFLRIFGEQRGSTALTASGFTLAIPVFFDTVFFLLVPLVRSMYRRTGKHYVKYLVAAGSCAAAHALIPPTPGPLMVAATLGVDLGVMMLAGFAVALPAVLASMLFGSWIDRRIKVTVPSDLVQTAEMPPDTHDSLPGLGWSLAPIVLPVVLIGCNTALQAAGTLVAGNGNWQSVAVIFTVLGNPNIALFLAAVVALVVYWRHRKPQTAVLSESVGEALMAGGVIVLITCAGGAFGASLSHAGLAPAIQNLAGESAAGGIGLLLLAGGIASLLKFAQGSSTAAMIVTSAMFAAMIDTGSLAFHPVYVATAIGSGSLIGSWMNDSGFWIFAKMGGLTELETLQTWTPLLAIMGVIGMLMTLFLAAMLPLA